MDKFDKMVEDLEDSETTVECKECFDLFPKADCIKQEVGYVCPTCHRALTGEEDEEFTSQDITTDLYDHEFPEVSDYDDTFTVKSQSAEDLGNAFDTLVKDEYDSLYPAETPARRARGKAVSAVSEFQDDMDEAIASAVPNGLHNPLSAVGNPTATLLASADPETEGETDLEEGIGTLTIKGIEALKDLPRKFKKVSAKDYNGILERTFTNGYVVKMDTTKIDRADLRAKVETALETKANKRGKPYAASDLATAVGFAIKLSKQFEDIDVHIIALEIDDSDFGIAATKLIDNRNGYSNRLVTYRGGKATYDKIRELASKLYEASKDDEVLGALYDGKDPRDIDDIIGGDGDDPRGGDEDPSGDDPSGNEDPSGEEPSGEEPSGEEPSGDGDEEDEWEDEFEDLEDAPAVTPEVVELLDSLVGGDTPKYYFRLLDPSGKVSIKQHGPLQKIIDFFTTGKGKVAKATIFFPVDQMKKNVTDKAEKVLAWFNANLDTSTDVSGEANPRGSVLLTTYEGGKRVEAGDDNLTVIINKLAGLKAAIEDDDLGDLFDDIDDDDDETGDEGGEEKKTDDDVTPGDDDTTEEPAGEEEPTGDEPSGDEDPSGDSGDEPSGEEETGDGEETGDTGDDSDTEETTGDDIVPGNKKLSDIIADLPEDKLRAIYKAITGDRLKLHSKPGPFRGDRNNIVQSLKRIGESVAGNPEEESKFVKGLQEAIAECADSTVPMTEEYRHYLKGDDLAAVESILEALDQLAERAVEEAKKHGYNIEIIDVDGYMQSEDTYSHRYFIQGDIPYESAEAAAVNSMLTTFVDAQASSVTLTQPVVDLMSYTAFPDEDLAMEYEADEGTPGMITFDLTFDKDLF